MLPEQLKDFRNFLWLVWKHLNLPQPTPVQYDIADFLQNGPKRSVIEAFRGVGKSYVTSAFVVHQLLLNPDVKVLVVSASKTRADDFSTFTQRLIWEMPILQHLIPKEGQRQSKIAFDVAPAQASHSPSVKSVGITGQLAGSRADLIIADDVEIPNNSATQMMREKLSESVKEFDAVLKPDGRIIYLGTPQTEMSLYETLPERGYSVRIWPARFPDEKIRVKYGDRLAPMIQDKLDRLQADVGTPTDPQRFSAEDLTERELSYGRSGFSLQFMLDTSLSDQDRYPLKLSDLVVMDLDTEKAPEKLVWGNNPMDKVPDVPVVGLNGDFYFGPQEKMGDWIPYTGSVMSIDPSGRGQDELGYSVVKMLNGQLFVTAAGGIQGGYKDNVLKSLAIIAKNHKVNYVIIESNFGDGMFTELFKPVINKIHPVTMEEVRHSKQKEKRIIDTLEPVMNQHKLIFDRKIILDDYKTVQGYATEKAMKYSLFYQMTRITAERGSLSHDDRLDALAIAVNYWVEQMAADAERNMETRRVDLLHKALDDFVDGVTVRRKEDTATHTWF